MAQSAGAEQAQKTSLEQFLQPKAWTDLNPALNVCNVERMKSLDVIGLDEATGNRLETLLIQEGYFHVPQLNWNLPLAEMAQGIARLVERGLVPPFCYMYDEYWLLFCKLHGVLKRLLGEGYAMLPDFWAWHVDPRSGGSGWRPHRDKTHKCLFPDRRPKSLSVWVPLTEATTLNGCIYLLPADRDPTYGTPEDSDWRIAFQDIRAVPSLAGGLLCWTQEVLHWGSRSSPRAQAPRISLAFEFQRGDVPPFNQPLIKPLAILSVEQRLKLICKQILQYKHMYPLSPALQQFAETGLARGN